MDLLELNLPGVLLIEFDKHRDDRGSFMEFFSATPTDLIGAKVFPKVNAFESSQSFLERFNFIPVIVPKRGDVTSLSRSRNERASNRMYFSCDYKSQIPVVSLISNDISALFGRGHQDLRSRLAKVLASSVATFSLDFRK